MGEALPCLVCTFLNPPGSNRCKMCGIEIGMKLEGGVPLDKSSQRDKAFTQESVHRELFRGSKELACTACMFVNPSTTNRRCKTRDTPLHDEKVVMREAKIVDQFGPAFKHSIEKYHTPGAICGYTSTAAAHFIVAQQNELRAKGLPLDIDAFQGILDQLNDEDLFVKKVEVVMHNIQEDRKRYVSHHASEFKNKREKDGYIMDWVANYEISDMMSCSPSEIRGKLHFVRHIERDTVRHEEERRLVEEIPFRGVQFFIESYLSEEEIGKEEQEDARESGEKGRKRRHKKEKSGGRRKTGDRILLNPFDWKNRFERRLQVMNVSDAQQSLTTIIPEDVFIMDLQGHFGVAKPMLLDGVKTLLLINTTSANYLDRPILDKFAKVYFWSSDVDGETFVYHP